MAARGGGTGINPNQDAQGLFICICLRVARGANPNPSHRVSGLGTERLRHLSSYMRFNLDHLARAERRVD